MQNNTYGDRAGGYLELLITKLQAIQMCPAYFAESTASNTGNNNATASSNLLIIKYLSFCQFYHLFPQLLS